MDCRHFIASLALLMLFSTNGQAATVNLVGTFGSKALLSIDGSAPRSYAVGQKPAEGITVIAVEHGTATLDIDGQRRTLQMGQHYAASSKNTNPSVTLMADGRGHFVTQGAINGSSISFLVDTGASFIAIPASDARRMGLNYYHAPKGMVSTANGLAPAYKLKLDTVRVGSITLNNVDAMVLEGSMPNALLGMSFLNRMQMQRDGERMTLTKRY